MKKLIPAAVIAALAIAVPAQACNNAAGHDFQSHKFSAGWHHKFAAGTLVSQDLTKNDDGTYSGTVTLNLVKWGRHHGMARSAWANESQSQSAQRQFTLDHAKVKFDVTDQDPTGTVDQSDLRAGDRVVLFGKRFALFRDPKPTS
jgi:hypothetical protein